MTRRLLVILVLGIAMVLPGCTVAEAPAPTLSRTALAREAATGVVAAAARGEALELSFRFGRDFDDAAIAQIQQTVPSSLGADPKMYSATFAAGANPEVDDTVQVIVRQDMVEPASPLEFRVTLRWNKSKPADSPGESTTADWDVLSIDRR